MKKIKSESEDWIRPGYTRSELRGLTRGKYADANVEFSQLVYLLLACIGEDEGIHFQHHSAGHVLGGHKRGDWAYEITNSNDIILRHWLDEVKTVEELISDPPIITDPKEMSRLQEVLLIHVRALKKVVRLS
jgi:hypothetical protein